MASKISILLSTIVMALLVYLFLGSESANRLPTLVDAEQAPLSIRKEVMYGKRIVLNTPEMLPDYVGNKQCCCNCHFAGGNTYGGKNGSISLVGVAYTYPRFMERDKSVIDLAFRVDNCFQRSLNGKSLPKDSPEMKAILSYLNWISKPVEGFKEFPWMGLKPIKSKDPPNAERGKILYERHCSACHLSDGTGTTLTHKEEMLDIPPLWGDGAFNDGAGMSNIQKIAPFIYMNMPYQAAYLTEQEALDIAAYVSTKPRPHFENRESK